MLARLDEAAQRLAPGDMVFFFFSGHGVAVNAANYTCCRPTCRPWTSDRSLTGAAVKEEDVIDRFPCRNGHAVRGGSWYDHTRNLRAACRHMFDVDVALSSLGLRLARTLAC